ncbi:MAG: metallophosphoesterase family protein [Gluconacetobacter diazotrophicus]|nr:metallophosphoesterase family protein [Gluconacetobacter diazotrophicus]
MAAVSFPPCLPATGQPKPVVQQDARGLSRLAVVGGSYGNLPALRACLEHARRAGCDGFAFLGDATGFCGHSDETVETIRRHFPLRVAGNYEQKAAAREEDCGCNYANPADDGYGGLAHRWAMRSLGDANRAWLGTWPDLLRLETAAGPLLLCHGSPAQTNEFLYDSQLDAVRLEGWLDRFGAVGFLCTHSGFPWVRRLGGGRFAVNCGVCGKPDHDGDPAVHYATVELRADAAPPRVRIERVEYDHAAWADQLDAEGVDEVFTVSLRDGIWRCGLLSLPPAERANPATGNLAAMSGIQTDAPCGLIP